MTNYAFVFESNDIFAIIGRGLVFRGQVVMGTASKGDYITILGSEGFISGTIAAIEKDRRLIDHAVLGVEISILLTNLTNKKLEHMIHTSHINENDYPLQDSYQQLLGISMPARLVIDGNQGDA